ncbi:tyrosine-type recombinase/integrase [Desulfococcus sp.]|uniref:tyrosine-type recombinase/integrase n=1 Tax=Desulfococcus sp. TaxID=2025834 RepID=UPI0035930832
MEKAKRSGRVNYWIDYRLPGGKQRREMVGPSLADAKAAEGKRRGQKRENRIFDILPESRTTFRELSDWYLELSSVKGLRSYGRVVIGIGRFLQRLGDVVVGNLKNVDLEEYQAARSAEGVKPATIDYELSVTKTMIEKAFTNDRIGGDALKAFRKTSRMLKRGSNAREQTLTPPVFVSILREAPPHLRNILITAFNTGMRPGEIRGLTWAMVDRNFLRLPAELTKEKAAKRIPINHHVRAVLDAVKPGLSLVDGDHHGFVFTYLGKPIRTPGGLRRSFKHACEKAGVLFGQASGIVFKDIRRTVKTNMVSAGVDKVYRDMILGHSLKGMDVHYIKPGDDELTAAMDKYTEWLDRELKNVDQNVDQGASGGLMDFPRP